MEKRNDAIYKSLSSERYTPYSLARKIGAKVILESASFAKGRERYSLLMAEEAFKIIQDEDGVAFIVNGKRIPFNTENVDSRDAIGRKKEADILDALLYVAEENQTPLQNNNDEIPLPASGLGYLSYEFAARCDKIKFFEQKDDLKIPESLFIAGHIYIIFDHFTESMHIFGLNYNEHQIDLQAAVDNLIKRMNDMDFSYVDEGSQSFEYKILTDIEKSKKEYQQKVIDNCQALAKAMLDNGFNLVSGGSDNHLMLVDLRSKNITGKELEQRLDKVFITANKNAIPNDPEKPFVTSGLRLGTPAVTTRGLGAEEMVKIAEYISLAATDFDEKANYIREGVTEICNKYPLY